MKKTARLWIAAAAVCALHCGGSGTRAQQAPRCPTWEILDRVTRSDAEHPFGNAFAIDAKGHYFYDIFVDPKFSPWLVRTSADQGKTWTTAEQFAIDPDHYNYPLGLDVDPSGRVVVAGVVSTLNEYRGMVRTTDDEGQTWTASDTYLYPGSTDCKFYEVKRIDAALFSLGRCFSGKNTHWLVRRSLDSGRTWSNADFPHADQAAFSKAFSIAKAADGRLLTLGILDSDTGNRLLVRQSTDAGNTWNDVGVYQTTAGSDDVVGDLTVTSKGSVLIYGWVIDKKGHSHGVIRRSTDNGGTWTIVDRYQYRDDFTLTEAIAEDSWGRLYALSRTANTPSRRSLLRVSLDDGATWQDKSELFGDAGQAAGFVRLHMSPGNELFATGNQGASSTTAIVARLHLMAPDVACREK